MSLTAQVKFLRFLQEREFQRLGGTRPIKANVRVIAATNRDLRKAVERSTFREDLYYRLQVFEIAIPPLRDRKSDVLPLADVFLQDIARSFGRPVAGLTAGAKRALLDHSWPGNVRELRNALERAAILSEGGLIAPQHLLLPTGWQLRPRGNDHHRSQCGRTSDRRARDCARRVATSQARQSVSASHAHGYFTVDFINYGFDRADS